MSTTGKTCETPGLYFSSGACGHAWQQIITKGQEFPKCRFCGMSVTWTLLRPLLSGPQQDLANRPSA
jgi:hypothetical protein